MRWNGKGGACASRLPHELPHPPHHLPPPPPHGPVHPIGPVTPRSVPTGPTKGKTQQ
jgi:hypothetical protein